MTISSETRVAGPFLGDAAAATFAFAFKVFSTADVQVVKNVAGVESTLILTTDYSVLLNADQDANPGGSITLTAGALPIGQKVAISTNVAYTQGVRLTNLGGFFPEVVTNALDKLTILLQQLVAKVNRTLAFPISDGTTPSALPTATVRADRLLSFNPATGQPEASAFTSTQLASVIAAIYAAASGPLDALSFIQAGLSAQSRTAQDKARERVSVFDFMTAAQKADVIAGTALVDVTAAIQACIDYVMVQGGRHAVYMPAGRYRITSTLHAGYGASYQSVVIEGDGYPYRCQAGFNGTAIIADFNDRQAINFQGARGSVLRGVGILGRNYAYIMAQGLWGLTPLKDDTLVANCYDPAFPASASSRYAPYAGVTIDAFSGAAPGVPYPSGTYGRNFSSDVLIEDCWIGGFVVGVVNQPCDADGNGDFTKLRRCSLEANTYHVSVGNSQSRNVGLEGCVLSYFHTAFVNKVHGRQIGKFGGTIDNCSFFAGTQLFDLDAGYAGPIQWNTPYAESIWKLGVYGIGVVNTNMPMGIKNCEFNLTNQTDTRGVPAQVLDGGTPTLITFDGGLISGHPSVVAFGGLASSYQINGLKLRRLNDGVRVNTYEKLAHNFLAGGLMLPVTATDNKPAIFTATPNVTYDIDAGTTATPVTMGPVSYSKRAYPVCAWSRWAAPSGNPEYVLPEPNLWDVLGKASFSTCSLAGKTLTLVISAARTEAQFAKSGPYPGDVIYDDDSKSVFFVRSVVVGTKTILAELQNNYKFTGGVYVPITAFSAVTGNLYFGNSRVYLPQYFVRGDVSTASAVISNAGRDDGFGTFIDTDVLANDWLYVNDQVDRFFSPVDAKVTARSGAGNTITLSGNGARNLTTKALGFFIRQPPANV